jgi:hypothetical protein
MAKCLSLRAKEFFMPMRTPPSWLQAGSHPAENDRIGTRSLIGRSGVRLATDCAVTSTGGMNLSVSTGTAYVSGTVTAEQGMYQCYNDGAQALTVAPSHPTLARIDLVCITVNDSAYGSLADNVVIQIITGTPAAVPVVPNTPANSITLARVAVAATVTSINSGNITDLRTRAAATDYVLASSAATTVPALIDAPSRASGLIVRAPAVEQFAITNTAYSGTTVTYTCNNNFVAGDFISITYPVLNGAGTSGVTTPFAFSRVAVATASATQFTVTVASGLSAPVPTTTAGVARRILPNLIEVKSNDLSTNLVTLSDTGAWSNQAYTKVGEYNFNGTTTTTPTFSPLNTQLYLNNVFTGYSTYFLVMTLTCTVPSTGYIDPTLYFTHNGARISGTYATGTTTKAFTTATLTSSGNANAPGIYLSDNGGVNLFTTGYISDINDTLTPSLFDFTSISAFNRLTVSGTFSGTQTPTGLNLNLAMAGVGGNYFARFSVYGVGTFGGV